MGDGEIGAGRYEDGDMVWESYQALVRRSYLRELVVVLLRCCTAASECLPCRPSETSCPPGRCIWRRGSLGEVPGCWSEGEDGVF